MMLCTACAIPLIWFASPLVMTAFGWGAVGPQELARVAMLAQITSCSIPAQGLSAVLTSAYAAQRDITTLLKVSLLGLASFAPLGALGYLAFELPGIAVAMTLTLTVLTALQFATYARRHGLDVIKVLASVGFLPVLAGALAFAPFALVTGGLDLDRFAATAMALLSGTAMLAAMLLASPGVRRMRRGSA
jgi:peptidoglycan biosynthesis protein MviN/MurJ (putative lipid II flippase)